MKREGYTEVRSADVSCERESRCTGDEDGWCLDCRDRGFHEVAPIRERENKERA